ncbi:hypothetical protein GJAV_G00008260 [Gymnothorax javanicus]|nr:hypothetical protein GJAV_G00008260 [Gymnothorax javanicus]
MMAQVNRIKRPRIPHSTLERISTRIFPAFAQKVLFGKPEEFRSARLCAGVVFGAVSGVALYFGLMHKIPLPFVLKIIFACLFVGLCAVGGALSTYFRCAVLLMFPSMVGSRGQAYVMLIVMTGLYQGPISNIYSNVQDVAFSLGCNIELQIQHSKVMWKVVIDPFMQVMQSIVNNKEKFQNEAQNVTRSFQNIRELVMGEYGYDSHNLKSALKDNSTQELFVAKTMLRCEYVVQQGIDRCRDWFHDKWRDCMETAKAPLISHLLCAPMQFHFLCDVMRVMTYWCKEEIPVEGNFGQTYDMINASINSLGEDFSTVLVAKKTKQQSLFGVEVLQDEFTEELRKSFEEKKVIVEKVLEVFQILLSGTFIFIFYSAFDYARQYCQAIRFDNKYITTYFRQIDARRKKAGKRNLLPLKKAERRHFIYPWSLSMHSSELRLMTLGFLKVCGLALFIGMMLATDWVLYHIFDIIRRHTFTEFTFISSHQVEVNIGGQSMLASLLRKTIGAFNTSFNFDLMSSNRRCLPQPRALTPEGYLWTTAPILAMALMCCLQVYSNRLRRVICAFYFPKREKRRVLFLYNLQIQRRISYLDTQRRRLMKRGRPQRTDRHYRSRSTAESYVNSAGETTGRKFISKHGTARRPGFSFHEHHRQEHSVEPLERTRPFIIMDGHRKSLSEALLNGHPEKLLCELQTGETLYLLDLEKNQDLMPKPPNVYYYLPNGTGVSLGENFPVHCYYHGSVRGFSQSRVALSTCSGLRGVIVINETLSFELLPEEKALREGWREKERREEDEEMHLLNRADRLQSQAGGCGVTQTPVPSLAAVPQVHRSKRDILSETKYVELVLVVDHKEYLNYLKNNKTIIYRMLDVANQVDWFYRPLNVRVALLGLEIWSDQDKIQVDKNPTETLNRFLDWRTRELLPRLRHDNAQLIMGDSFDGTTVGMASQSSMCSTDRSGGVNVDHLVSVLGVASTVAHELGHNLGMSHDTADRRCQCQNEPRLGGCIMEPSTGFMPGQLFSSCSAKDLSLSLLHGGGMCLFNMPQPERLLGGPRCGNLYVEKGEECDCGLLHECNDPCCNASTCKLVPGAQCSSDGICCDNCKLRPGGWVCREPLGECDLSEHCTGASPYCPANVFLQDGTPCAGAESYCYSGVCSSLDSQCQMLWGPNSTKGPEVCFSSVNKQGSKHGNCGQMPNGTYIPCSAVDVLCGKIQCQGGSERPLLDSSAQILTTKVHLNHTDLVCRGTYFDLGDDVSDPAMVSQGAACAPGKACVNQRCQDVSVFGVEECRRKCNGHGVCNSNQNCHCEVGWAPPDCRYSGHGGSIDSGPATDPRESDPVRVALLVVFLVVLPVVLLFLALRYPRCRRKLRCLGRGPLHKGPRRQQNRTPATERVDARNGEQVLPLRYHRTIQTEIPLTPPSNKVQERPAPPNKPLPPDPVIKHTQSAGQRPAPPNKPLPPDPVVTGTKSMENRPAPPNKPLPPDPVLMDRQTFRPMKPPVPIKPLPADPSSHPDPEVQPARPTSTPPVQHGASVSAHPNYGPRVAVVPARRAPLPPAQVAGPSKSQGLAAV